MTSRDPFQSELSYDLSHFNPSCKASHPAFLVRLGSYSIRVSVRKEHELNDSSSRDWRRPPVSPARWALCTLWNCSMMFKYTGIQGVILDHSLI